MFNIGIGEVILIMAVALVFLGPEKFPVFAKTVLRAYRDVRGYYDDIKRDVVEELKPIRKDLQQLSRYNPEDYIESIAQTIDSEKSVAEKRSEEAVAAEAEVKAETADAEAPKKDAAPPGTEPRDYSSPYSD